MAATIDRPPDRTIEQRMVALARANEIRLTRAQLKRDIRAGRASAAEIIAYPPPWAEGMPVIDLLLASHRIGRVKAERLMTRYRIGSARRVGALTDRQRQALVDAFTEGLTVSSRQRRLCEGCGVGLAASNRGGLCGFCKNEIHGGTP